MKPSKKRSTYQIEFARPDVALVKDLYEEGLKFRNKKRNENQSCQFSLQWNSEESESEESDGDKLETDTGKYQVIYIKQSDDASKKHNKNKVNEEISGQETSKKEAKSLDKKGKNLVTSSTRDTGTSTYEDAIKSSRSNRKEMRSRPHSALDCVVRKQKPVFAQYGSGNQCEAIGDKKSFNAHAAQTKKKKKLRKMWNPLDETQSSIDLYTTSTTRENLAVPHSRKNSCEKKLKLRSQIEKGVTCQYSIWKKKSDTSQWMSEYRRCFSQLSLHAVDASTSSSSRPPTRNRKR